ncbi:MFS monocarboxylate transporter [Cordyceps javanica]|uniref:MFS monocarboxylate transporter n=1 Tax=Cordyceps javanica TaxID=43265 RepID=A0A545VMK4_9HYPO|nr:MFS monocarboxylate transporter [Cordyceps javanica]TQW02942.1 MFS monocarboxylate transporter [Cordyceps javanica]
MTRAKAGEGSPMNHQEDFSLPTLLPESEVAQPVPDGGLVAWAQVLGAHLTVCNSWGYVSAFGVFQTYYAELLAEPASDVSWIGSVQVFLLFFVGVFSGRAADAGYFGLTWGAGAGLAVLGIFASSFGSQYWQLLLSQGLCMGVGCGLMFCPVVSLIPTYFSRHRCLAVGLAGAGSAVGGLVFPAIVSRLLPRIGFPWTMRVLGFMTLTTLLVSWMLMRQRTSPRRLGPVVEWAAFRDLPYALFSVGMFLNFWGLYVAFFYISSFAENAIGFNQQQAIDLLMIMNGAGFLPRIGPSYLADRCTGPMNLMIPSALLSGVLILVWASVSDRQGLYVFVVLYGTFAASFQALFPATLASICPDMKTIGTRIGMVMTVISFASLTGPPLAGVLLAMGDGSYLYIQLFAGLTTMLGTGVLLVARVCKYGFAINLRA